MIRPEFQAFMESEQRTLALVNDVADTLESVAVNSSHTPALYSTFLRAVVTARTAEKSGPSSPRPNDAQDNNANTSAAQANANPNAGNASSPLDMALASNPAAGVFGEEQQFGDGALGLKMFPLSGSVLGRGPTSGANTSLGGAGVTPGGGAGAGDLAWNPAGLDATHGAHGQPGAGGQNGNDLVDLQAMSFQLPTQPGADDFSSLSMDNILSGGFWDNVLIPGM